MSTNAIVSKVWSFCNPLRDVGVGYGDYLEQLTIKGCVNVFRSNILVKRIREKLIKLNHKS